MALRSVRSEKITLIASIIFWTIAVNVLLRLLNIRHVIAIVSAGRRRSLRGGQIRRIVRYVDFVMDRGFGFFKSTCLKRSLVLYRFLNMYSPEVSFYIGVHNQDKKVAGHSWLTLGNKVFADSEEKIGQFTVIYRYPNSLNY